VGLVSIPYIYVSLLISIFARTDRLFVNHVACIRCSKLWKLDIRLILNEAASSNVSKLMCIN